MDTHPLRYPVALMIVHPLAGRVGQRELSPAYRRTTGYQLRRTFL